MVSVSELNSFLNKLDERSIFYRLSKIRPESIMLEVAVLGQRWEVELMKDGSVETVVFPLLRSVWQRLDRHHGAGTASQEGDTFALHAMALQEEGDVPVMLETHLAWLRDCRFHVATLHVHGNRGLMAAIK